MARQPPTSPQSNLRSDFVAEEADHSRGGQDPEMRELLRVDQPLDRLVERHASRDEDGKNDDKPGELLRSERANEERDPKRHRRQRIPEVVDEVSEERDRA